jgi:hypothetical protein
MTTRYEELEKHAIADSQLFFDESRACSRCVKTAISKLVNYLQAPSDSITFLALDSNLHVTENATAQLELKFSSDSAWHFAIQMHFGTPNTLNYQAVTLCMRIQPATTGFTLWFDRDFSVDPTQSDSFNAFADYVYTSLASDYSKTRGTRRRKYGFI